MTPLEDKMGRLLLWLIDDNHLVPMVSSDAKNYIISYMKAAINGEETANISYREPPNV